MKVAIIGSRSITNIDLSKYLSDTDEIVSGGAKGVDKIAAAYAKGNGNKLVEFFPEYEKYGRAAPIVRNKKIVEYSNKIIAFWDGKSKGTYSVIKYAQKIGKPCEIIICNENKL